MNSTSVDSSRKCADEPTIAIPLRVAQEWKKQYEGHTCGWRTTAWPKATVALMTAVDDALPYEFGLGDIVSDGAMGLRVYNRGLRYMDAELKLVCKYADRQDVAK